MLTRSITNSLLNIQYSNGYITYDELPNCFKLQVSNKHKNRKFVFNRKDNCLYYIGRTSAGLTANIKY